jgi:hypothetical protein
MKGSRLLLFVDSMIYRHLHLSTILKRKKQSKIQSLFQIRFTERGTQYMVTQFQKLFLEVLSISFTTGIMKFHNVLRLKDILSDLRILYFWKLMFFTVFEISST